MKIVVAVAVLMTSLPSMAHSLSASQEATAVTMRPLAENFDQLEGWWAKDGFVWHAFWQSGIPLIRPREFFIKVYRATGEPYTHFIFHQERGELFGYDSDVGLSRSGFFLFRTNDMLRFSSEREFQWMNAARTTEGGVRVVENQGAWNGTYRRISERERQAFQQVQESYLQQQASAEGGNNVLGLLGAVAGGVIAGSQAGGDMTAISAGMAAGSAMTAPNSEISSAANTNFQAERQRYEAEREAERRTIAAMNDPNNPLTQQQAPAATPQSVQGSSPSNQTAAGGGMRSHTTRAYFRTGLVPTAQNTRNPLCYSTPFTITFMTDPRFVDGEQAQAAAAQYVQLFLAKCSQLGRVDSGTPSANVEGVTSGWPYPALHA